MRDGLAGVPGGKIHHNTLIWALACRARAFILTAKVIRNLTRFDGSLKKVKQRSHYTALYAPSTVNKS